MAQIEKVIEALKQVEDPEIGVDIYTLGLIYNIDEDKGNISIRMTFTSPMCPYGPALVESVKQKIGKIKGVKKVDVEVVFNPPWKPTEELRAMLGV